MSPAEAETTVQLAIELGYRHIDCAWIYENERGVGNAIAKALKQGIVKRDELWITSKLWNDRHRAADVRIGLNETLAALQIDYLDLYLMHWPIAHQPGMVRPDQGADFLSLQDVPLAETWQAMEVCRADGACRAIGVSNFNIPKLDALISQTGIRPAMNQVEAHPFLQQTALLQYCQREEIGFTAYSPLGSGDRPEQMKRPGEPSLLQHPIISKIADDVAVTPAQVLLAWATTRGTITIPKSARRENLELNLAAVDVLLNPEQMEAIANLELGHRFIDGSFWEKPGGPYSVHGLWEE
jgi:alcohol dehydrogenase (NADP+)